MRWISALVLAVFLTVGSGTAALAASAEKALADYENGLGRLRVGDYASAVRWFEISASKGNATAQSHLGDMYLKGQGITQDYDEAVKWYRKAAEQGNARAQFNLGLMYRKGFGALQDYDEAVKWYRKAAEQGNAPAQGLFGIMYANGLGVLQDDIMAHMWFNISSANGGKTGADNRAKIEKKMTASQIAEAQKLARKCMKQNYRSCSR